ncbi:hypothetical protein ILYODFUR_029631 [Ilyodon furcidens]|uniref:Uncharacterized protein n=1 Tax=Ilyodon furcidens TaxID=33524 RepID=A0ABV0T1B5_9TELE
MPQSGGEKREGVVDSCLPTPSLYEVDLGRKGIQTCDAEITGRFCFGASDLRERKEVQKKKKKNARRITEEYFKPAPSVNNRLADVQDSGI